MSHNSYRFTEEKDPAEKIPIPKRISILIDAYLAAGRKIDKSIRMHYDFQTIDNLESLFEQKLRMNPNSLKILITAIYRIKHDNQEWYTFNLTKTCKNALNNPERFSYDQYGHHSTPVITMRWNEGRQKSEPTVTSYEHGFELKFDKAEVKRLLDSSTVPCQHFFVGQSGTLASDIISNPYYQIQNKEDFLNGSFDDLMDLERLGISYKEPSIYLIPAARKKERENREATVGMREPKLYT